jgi:hypothetical protein
MTAPGAYLTTLFAGTTVNPFLATSYGFGQQPANASGLTPTQALRSAELHETKQVAVKAASTGVSHDIAVFRKIVGQATSLDQVFANPLAVKVLLTANGLGDQTGATALAKRALASDLSDPKSLVNRLADPRWKQMAQTYDFARQGLAVLKQPNVLDTVAHGYAEVAWRQDLDKQTPGLSDALTFRAEAAGITSVDQILGDALLRRVVTTALGVPQEIAFQSLDAQEKAISSRLEISHFKDPKFVEQFTQRFLTAKSSTASSKTQDDLSTLSVRASGLLV